MSTPRSDVIAGPTGEILGIGDDGIVHSIHIDDDGPTYRAYAATDLAGRGRAVAPFAAHDPQTGELHLLATAADGTQLHVVVGAGALTRRVRPLPASRHRIDSLAIAGDHVVLSAPGFIGIAPREGEARITWIDITAIPRGVRCTWIPTNKGEQQ